MATGEAFFSEVNAIWPDLANQKAIIAPARNGMDRFTGKLLQGFDHVEQSMEMIFATPFHERVLRRWVGSFVPLLLGESGVPRIITRFFWAIGTALELWEPNYRIKQVHFMGNALNTTWSPQAANVSDLFRLGEVIFRTEGSYRPRAHLGDFSPYIQRHYGLISRGGPIWDVTPLN